MLKIFILSILFFQVFTQNSSSCAGTACSNYCCPSTLQVCSSPAFSNICWGYCDAANTCGNSCCENADECQKEKPGSFCVANVYPYIGKTITLPNINWVYIEWYTVDNTKMVQTFAPVADANVKFQSPPNNYFNQKTIANFSTSKTNYFTAYGTWGATSLTDMQIKFTCEDYIEPCKVAYSIRGGLVGTSFSQEEQ